MERLIGKGNIIICLLVLPYILLGCWLAWDTSSSKMPVRVKYQKQVNDLNRQWCAQFRQASDNLQNIYLTMPKIQESWSRTNHPNIFTYYIMSRVSTGRIISVQQAFEVTSDGVRPTSNPKYFREDVLKEHKGYSSWSITTTNRTHLTPPEFHQLYLQYKISMPVTTGQGGAALPNSNRHGQNEHSEVSMFPPLAAP